MATFINAKVLEWLQKSPDEEGVPGIQRQLISVILNSDASEVKPALLEMKTQLGFQESEELEFKPAGDTPNALENSLEALVKLALEKQAIYQVKDMITSRDERASSKIGYFRGLAEAESFEDLHDGPFPGADAEEGDGVGDRSDRTEAGDVAAAAPAVAVAGDSDAAAASPKPKLDKEAFLRVKLKAAYYLAEALKDSSAQFLDALSTDAAPATPVPSQVPSAALSSASAGGFVHASEIPYESLLDSLIAIEAIKNFSGGIDKSNAAYQELEEVVVFIDSNITASLRKIKENETQQVELLRLIEGLHLPIPRTPPLPLPPPAFGATASATRERLPLPAIHEGVGEGADEPSLAETGFEEDIEMLEVNLKLIKALKGGLDGDKLAAANEIELSTQLRLRDLQVLQQLNKIPDNFAIDLPEFGGLSAAHVSSFTSGLAEVEKKIEDAKSALKAAREVESLEKDESIKKKILGGPKGLQDATLPKLQAITRAENQLEYLRPIADRKLQIAKLAEQVSLAKDALTSTTTPQGALAAFQALEKMEKSSYLLGLSVKNRPFSLGEPFNTEIGKQILEAKQILEDPETKKMLNSFVVAQLAEIEKKPANFTKAKTSTDLETQKTDLNAQCDLLDRAVELAKIAYTGSRAPAPAPGIAIASAIALLEEKQKAAKLVLNELELHILDKKFEEALQAIEDKITAANTTTHSEADKAKLKITLEGEIKVLFEKFNSDHKALIDPRSSLGETPPSQKDVAERKLIGAPKRIVEAHHVALQHYHQTVQAAAKYYTPPPPISTWIAKTSQLSSVFTTEVVERGSDPWMGLGAAPDLSGGSELEMLGSDVEVLFQKRQIASDKVVRSIALLQCNPKPDGSKPQMRVAIELDPAKKTASNRLPQQSYNNLSEESKQLAALQQANLLITSCSNLKKANIYIRCPNDQEANKLYAALLALGVPDKQIKSANKNIDRAGKMTWDSTIIKRHLGGMEDRAAQMKKDLHDMKASVKEHAAQVEQYYNTDLTRMGSDASFTGKVSSRKP